MIFTDSAAIVLRTDLEQFRVTLFDAQRGKIRAVFFDTVSPGMIIKIHITSKNPLPHAQLKEILEVPLQQGRVDIWWFHMVLSLIDTAVPLGSGIGPLYEQLTWLCSRDQALDKRLQIRYCAKIITTLGLQSVLGQLCNRCMSSLHTTTVDDLGNLSFDSTCSTHLAAWVTHSMKEHVGPSFVLYMQNKDYWE